MLKTFTALLSATILAAPMAAAAPVNGTGDITANVIMGTGGIANGSWTGVTLGTLELALRAKLRYDETGQPRNVFNYDGDRTYRFDPTGMAVPAGRQVFNFEVAVNTDVGDTDDTPQRGFSSYAFELAVDTDPGASVLGPTFDLRSFPLSFGFNSTPPAQGQEGAFADDRNVAQESSNNGFLPVVPSALGNGRFTYTLTVFEFPFDPSNPGSPGAQTLVGSTSIEVIVGPIAPIPLPATLPLLLAGAGGLALLRRRKG